MSDGGRPGDEAVEAALDAYWEVRDRTQDNVRAMQAAIAAADRVRSRPVSGTQGEDHEAGRTWTLLICSHCGAEAGGGAHGHSDAPDWHWEKVKVAPLSRTSVPSPVSGTEPDTANGEEVCRRCGGPNRPWAALSPLWNAVMRGGSIDGRDEFDGIICPTCFVVLAEERGIACDWWVEADTVTAELETVTPSGRTWDPVARRWVDAADGTQDKDHKPDMCPGCGCRRCICDYLAVPSPVSGTEPDTAKLVEALRELMGEAKAWLEPSGTRANPAMHKAREALAGFSVDAGKQEP